jgi:EF hand domain-containing protein
MNKIMIRTVVCVALVGGGAGAALADTPQEKGASPRATAGQHWAELAKAFDADGDGKISKQEFLAKRPLFDRVDANHDGAITQQEIRANPVAQRRGKSGLGFMERFDGDRSGKVTIAEYDLRRARGFDRLDKNKDGQIDESEVKGQAEAEMDDLGA